MNIFNKLWLEVLYRTLTDWEYVILKNKRIFTKPELLPALNKDWKLVKKMKHFHRAVPESNAIKS